MKKPFKYQVGESKYCADPCSYRADEKVKIGSGWCRNVCKYADGNTPKHQNNTPNRDFNRSFFEGANSDLVMCHQILGRRKDGSVRMRINPNNK